jgi:hypothetical protein
VLPSHIVYLGSIHIPVFLDGTGISIGRGNENKVFSINIAKEINKKQFTRS